MLSWMLTSVLSAYVKTLPDNSVRALKSGAAQNLLLRGMEQGSVDALQVTEVKNVGNNGTGQKEGTCSSVPPPNPTICGLLLTDHDGLN